MPHMVDVGNKNVTRRVARARALVDLPKVIVEQFDKQKKDIQSKVMHPRKMISVRLTFMVCIRRKAQCSPPLL